MRLKWRFLKLLLFVLYVGRLSAAEAVILSGGPNSFSRYPKWAQTFENQLNFEFKTKVDDALLLYTDDGDIHSNFYAISITDGRLQLDFRLGEESQDDLVKRPVNTIRVQDVAVNDNRWHKFVLFQAWENVKVQVDDTVVFKILNQRSFTFGNLRTNSDVFVGGLPKDLHHLNSMSSPLRRHSKHFAGSIKNLVYRLYPQGVSSPQQIDSNGTRQTDDEYCSSKLTYSSNAIEKLVYCKNNGRCYSSNTGPNCDCSFTDYEGKQCDTKKKTTAEMSFFANEWLGYDLSSIKTAGVAGVWSRRENLTLHFKTSSPNGLLFAGGDHQNYVQLMLERGVLLAVCKLEGSEKRIIRLFNKSLKPARYDDDIWHSVMLYRDLSLMRLTVDGYSDEVKQLATNIEWLGNSFAFVGGAPHSRLYIPNHLFQFKGCMKKVKFEADAIQLDLIDLADQGYGNSVVQTSGDLSFSCSNPINRPDILSFNSGQHFITLPTWNSLSSGSLGFQFRLTELDGLILYHGLKTMQNQSTSDFIAFEIIDGHLYFIINLGSGHVRLQTTSKRVNDGNWHTVAMERVSRTGSVAVDSVKTVFSTPGVSANLIINDEPIFVGAAPWTALSQSHKDVSNKNFSLLAREFPSAVWTIQLRKGLIGCLKNLRINGINAQIATQIATSAFEKDYTSKVNFTAARNEAFSKEQLGNKGITIGCAAPYAASKMDHCNSGKSTENPCQNFGKCFQSLNTFKCDCSNTLYEGPTCSIKPQLVSFPLATPSSLQYTSFSTSSDQLQLSIIEDFPPIFRLPRQAQRSEVEDFELKFRTEDDSGVLFDTTAPYAPSPLYNKKNRILLLLVNGELELKLVVGNGSKHTFNWGTSLNDNQWHMIQIKRRGEKLFLFVDGKWENNYFLPDSSNIGIYIEEISVGRALRKIDSRTGSELSDESQERSSFDGDILSLHYNRFDVLEETRRLVLAYSGLHDLSSTTTYHTTAARRHNKTFNTVSFKTTNGYAQLMARKVEQATGFYRISFKLKTLSTSGLLFLIVDQQGREPEKEFIAAELHQKRLKYTIGYWTTGAGRQKFNVEHAISPLWFEDSNFALSLRKPVEPLDDLKWHFVNIQQDTLTGSHHIWINNFTMSLRPSTPFIARIKGHFFLAGIPKNYTLVPSCLSSTPGFRGCLSNLKLGKDHLNIWSDSHLYFGMHKGCSGPSIRCSPTVCKHNGLCHQGWKGIKCDCSMTTHSGPFCDQMGTSFSFNALGSSIYYEYPSASTLESTPPSTSDDQLVLAFSSFFSNGVLFSVQCSVDDDYLTMFLGGGYLQVKYNLGSREHHLGYFDIFVNDGRRHVVRMSRIHTNMTLTLDNNMPIKYVPTDPKELFTLNSYWRITVGGSFNVLHNLPQIGLEPTKGHKRSPKPVSRELTKVYDEFNGNISGLNFNGLRILDLFARGHSRTFSTGKPQLLHMAMFDEPNDPNKFVKLHSYSSQNFPDFARPSSSGTNYSDAQFGDSSDSFFDNTPLGCLPYEATSECDRSEAGLEEGFFTPVLPKAFHHQQTPQQAGVSPTRRPSTLPRTDSSSQLYGTSHEVNQNNNNRIGTSYEHATHKATSAPLDFRPSYSTPAPKINVKKTSLLMNTRVRAPQYFEPLGGWPPRTRTGLDGRKFIIGPSSRQVLVNGSKTESQVLKHAQEEEEEDGEEDPQDYEQPEDEEEENDLDEGLPDPKYYNQNGEELKLENGNKVKALWKDLEKAIEQKPWTRVTPTSRVTARQTAPHRNLQQVYLPPATRATNKQLKMTYRSKQVPLTTTTTLSTTTAAIPLASPKKISRNSSPSNVWIPYKPNEPSQINGVFTNKKVFEASTKKWTPLKLENFLRTSTANPSTTDNSVIHFTFVAAAEGSQQYQTPISSTPASTARHRLKTNPLYDPTLEAVRPTTPMNHPGMMVYTTKAPEVSEIPRTALVVLASLSVVLMVALILIFVFCKRSSSNQDSTYYPMVCAGNGKSMTGGYTAIAPSSTEPSPQFQHHQMDQPGVTFGTKVNTQHNKTMTSLLPSAMKNGGGVHTGYQPIKGSTLPLPTANGQPLMGGTMPRQHNGGSPPNGDMARHSNGTLPGSRNNSNGELEAAKKKEFKEWYV